jgi:hypothetical protein
MVVKSHLFIHVLFFSLILPRRIKTRLINANYSLSLHLAELLKIHVIIVSHNHVAMSAFLNALPVYTGVWINWAYGPVLGSTLTLEQRGAASE